MPVWRRFFSVFPTGVGVIPMILSRCFFLSRIPHGCGGDPMPKDDAKQVDLYSPRVWG
ncbi:hypothetical protein [Levilactobacillus brevis]|uniref:hypothetical protein n=1 Tax=Levilactobacillus brevis TaxID=1580 RepID=UPI0039E32E9F